MIRPEDVYPENWEQHGIFAVCETLTEILVATNKVLGIDGVEKLLAESGCTRESLRTAADEIGHVGLKDLASIIRRHARKAKPAPQTFAKRWGDRSI